MAQLYQRDWRLLVLAPNGSKVFDSEGNNALDLSNLRFTFRVEKNFSHYMQFAEVTLYNLKAETETAIMARGEQIVLEAGYANGNYGVIFRGYIRQPIRGKEDGVTTFLKLLCIDGDDALNLGFCNFTLEAGKTARDIALMTARSSTEPFTINIDPNLGEQQTQRGKAVFGQPKQFLRSLAINENAQFRMENGQAHIDKLLKQPTSDIVVKVNAETGMVGMPQQIDSGVRVRTLLNPKIKINNFIRLNNRDIRVAEISLGQLQTTLDLDGLYRVIKIVAFGDTRGNDWYYDLETVSQTGYLPAMLTDQYQSGV